MRRVRDERARLHAKIEQAERPDLDTGRATLRALLDLLSKPDDLYRLAGERARKVLNQAVFTRPYVDADDDGDTQVTDDEPTDPFAPLIRAHRTTRHNHNGAARPSDAVAIDESSPSALLMSALACGCVE